MAQARARCTFVERSPFVAPWNKRGDKLCSVESLTLDTEVNNSSAPGSVVRQNPSEWYPSLVRVKAFSVVCVY